MRRSYLKFFLFSFLVFLFLFFPKNSSALEEHRPDPLSDIHDNVFGGEVTFSGFDYSFFKNVSPIRHGKRRARKSGEKFITNLSEEVSNKVLKIEFAGESVYDNPSIEDPVLNIVGPKGDSFSVKLNKPEIYISCLSQGRYTYEVKGIGMGYKYAFDIDLVDWFFAGKVIYVSNSFDAEDNKEKIDKFLDENEDRLLVSANDSLNLKYGLSLESREFSDQANNSVVINLANIKKRLNFISSSSELSSIYSIDEGDLVAGKTVGDDKLIAISPDLTSLSVSSLKPVLGNISDYYLKHQQTGLAWRWLAALLAIFILGFFIYTKKISLKSFFRSCWLEFDSWRDNNKRNILFALIAIAFLCFVFAIVYISFGSFGLVKILRAKLAGIDNKEWLFAGGLSVLVILGLLTYFEFVWAYFIGVVREYKKAIIYLLLATFSFEAYNLVFDFYPSLNKYLGYLLAFLLILYFVDSRDSLDKRKLLLHRHYLNFILVIVVALAPIYFIWISQPYWQPKPWIKRNIINISDGRVDGSYGFNLTNKKSKTEINSESLSIKGRQDFAILPKLAGVRPDEIDISIDGSNLNLVFLQAKSDDVNKDFLIDYPGLSNYSKVATDGELAVWLNEKSISDELSSIKDVEKFVNSMPSSLSLETSQDLVAGSSPLEQGKEDIINLYHFYKEDVSSSSDLSNYELDVRLDDYSIYSYFKDEIEIEVKKHDLNKVLGSDQANLAIYGPSGDLVEAVKLSDDNRSLGQAGEAKSFRVKLDNINEGVYNLRFYDFSDGDIVLDEISLNSSKLSFDSNYIPNSIDTGHFYRPDKKMGFVSPTRDSYLYPYNRPILSPDNNADILIYRDPKKISQNYISYLGGFNFSLFTNDRTNFVLNSIVVDYEYY